MENLLAPKCDSCTYFSGQYNWVLATSGLQTTVLESVL